MFHIPAIPEAVRKEFLAGQTALVKRRVCLLCATVLVLYFATLLIDLILRPYLFNVKEIPFSGFLLLSGTFILLWNEKVRTLQAAKLNAYLFAGLLLLLLVKLGFIYPEQAAFSSAYYLLILFFVSLVIPWTVPEAVGLAALTLGAFVIYYMLMSRFTPELAEPYFPLDRYVDGLFLISVSAIMCVTVRKHESARDAENFVLLKEVEGKNEQIRQELELARKIHKTLIPDSVSTERADIAVTYLPMNYIGGDYAKFHFLGEERFIFIISDVTGHGVPAALLVNRLHAEFERLAREAQEPGALLKELDQFITRDFEGTNMYLSAFCGLLNFGTNSFVYSNYGHPPQYIYHANRADIRRLDSQTTLLGLSFRKEDIYQNEIRFDRGDQLLLFTDGVLESIGTNGGADAMGKLEGFLKGHVTMPPREFNQALVTELSRGRRGEFKDDLFILTIKIN